MRMAEPVSPDIGVEYPRLIDDTTAVSIGISRIPGRVVVAYFRSDLPCRLVARTLRLMLSDVRINNHQLADWTADYEAMTGEATT